MSKFSGVKVFTATMAKGRAALGDDIARWLKEHPGVEVVDRVVAQSSDNSFHCLSIILFYAG